MERGHRTTSTEGEPGGDRGVVDWCTKRRSTHQAERKAPLQENNVVHLLEQCAVMDVERGRWVIWEDMCIQK